MKQLLLGTFISKIDVLDINNGKVAMSGFTPPPPPNYKPYFRFMIGFCCNLVNIHLNDITPKIKQK